MNYADVNDIKICYEIQGEGYPLLLVHGFGSKKEDWIGQYGALSENYKVIRFDNRGAGKSDRPDEPVTLEMFADDIAGLMDFLKVDKAHIVGWSLGGMIVQHFLLKYPERINKAVLLLTNYKGSGVDLYKEMRHKQLDLLLQDPEKKFWEGIHMGYHISFRKQMKEDPKKKFHGIWSAQDLIEESTIDPPTHKDIDNQAGSMSEHYTLDRLHEIKNEVLLVAGSHDRLCPQSTMLEMHEKLPNSTFQVIDKAGHGAPLSRAPEVNKLIIDFLEISKEKMIEPVIE